MSNRHKAARRRWEAQARRKGYTIEAVVYGRSVMISSTGRWLLPELPDGRARYHALCVISGTLRRIFSLDYRRRKVEECMRMRLKYPRCLPA